MMNDKDRGLYNKYIVQRTDGDPAGRHQDCFYFVLDLDHDQHAILALKAYARSCRLDYPLLSKDLINITDTRQSNTLSIAWRKLAEAIRKAKGE